MDIFVFILAIVALGIIGDVVKRNIDSKAEKNSSNNDSRFDALEERIVTLERIVTDQKTQLKQSIDSL